MKELPDNRLPEIRFFDTISTCRKMLGKAFFHEIYFENEYAIDTYFNTFVTKKGDHDLTRISHIGLKKLVSLRGVEIRWMLNFRFLENEWHLWCSSGISIFDYKMQDHWWIDIENVRNNIQNKAKDIFEFEDLMQEKTKNLIAIIHSTNVTNPFSKTPFQDLYPEIIEASKIADNSERYELIWVIRHKWSSIRKYLLQEESRDE